MRPAWISAVLIALAFAFSPARAVETFPALTGRVVDQAGILSPITRADLEGKLSTLESKSGIQLVVATVSSLGGQEIEPYANDLFRAWKLGEAKKNNGVLFLIAPNEHRVRIEVGYGLEGTLTDALSKIIIVNAVAPRFKAGDFNAGVSRGVDDIITVLTTDFERMAEEAGIAGRERPLDLRHDRRAVVRLRHHLRNLPLRQSRRHGRQYDRTVFVDELRRLFRRRLLRRRGRIFRWGRIVRRRRRLGELVMAMTPDDAKTVEAAFAAAQAKTRSPLVGVLAEQSGEYALLPLIWSGAVALATPWPLLLFTELSAERIFTAQLALCLFALALFSSAPIRVRLTPLRSRRAQAHRAALVQFAVRGLDHAPERNGVLIYVSLAERYARIVAGEAVSRSISAEQWQGEVDALVADLAARGAKAALCETAARCAGRLARDFPPDPARPAPAGTRFHAV